jgi:hypothetical protein
MTYVLNRVTMVFLNTESGEKLELDIDGSTIKNFHIETQSPKAKRE